MSDQSSVMATPSPEPESSSPHQPLFERGAPKIEGLKAGSEIAKQLITLSVGMIALTITFMKEIVEPDSLQAPDVPWQMVVAWIFYILCILGSVATLQGICGAMTVLDRLSMSLPIKESHKGGYDVYASTVRIPMLIMILSFLLAIVFTVVAATTRDAPSLPARLESGRSVALGQQLPSDAVVPECGLLPHQTCSRPS